MDKAIDPASYFWEKNRLKSFQTNWTPLKGIKLCTPENFSKAGFYNYSSKDSPDCVKCFACNKELDGWEKGDDPWAEHKKRGQQCPFVQLQAKNPDDDNVFKFEDILKLYFDMMETIVIESHTKRVNALKQSIEVIRALKNGNLEALEKELS